MLNITTSAGKHNPDGPLRHAMRVRPSSSAITSRSCLNQLMLIPRTSAISWPTSVRSFRKCRNFVAAIYVDLGNAGNKVGSNQLVHDPPHHSAPQLRHTGRNHSTLGLLFEGLSTELWTTAGSFGPSGMADIIAFRKHSPWSTTFLPYD